MIERVDEAAMSARRNVLCAEHASFKSKAQAKAAIRDHRMRYPRCSKCVRGKPLKAFSCEVATHWHIGHLWGD